MGRIYLKAEDLQKFWDEHQSECSDNFLKISHYYGYENDSKRYSGLEVSGVSRLVTVCMLEKYGSHNYSKELGEMVDTPPVWNNETAFWALENIKTGKLYRISGGHRDTTFSFSLLNAVNVDGFDNEPDILLTKSEKRPKNVFSNGLITSMWWKRIKQSLFVSVTNVLQPLRSVWKKQGLKLYGTVIIVGE